MIRDSASKRVVPSAPPSRTCWPNSSVTAPRPASAPLKSNAEPDSPPVPSIGGIATTAAASSRRSCSTPVAARISTSRGMPVLAWMLPATRIGWWAERNDRSPPTLLAIAWRSRQTVAMSSPSAGSLSFQ